MHNINYLVSFSSEIFIFGFFLPVVTMIREPEIGRRMGETGIFFFLGFFDFFPFIIYFSLMELIKVNGKC